MLKVLKFLSNTFKKLYLLLIISFIALVYFGELALITEIGGIRVDIIGTYMLATIIFAPILLFPISFFIDWEYDIAYGERKHSSSMRTTYSYSNDDDDDYKSNNTKKNYHSQEEVKEKKYLDVYSAMSLGMSAEDVVKYNLGDYDTVMKHQETALHIDKTDIFFGG